MKVDRTDLLLDHIRRAETDAARFVKGVGEEDFVADAKLRYAVAMCLIVIGENVARLTKHHPEFLATHPQTPWAKATALRNRIAHGYEQLDFAIVWQTATTYLSDLLRTLPPSKPFEE